MVMMVCMTIMGRRFHRYLRNHHHHRRRHLQQQAQQHRKYKANKKPITTQRHRFLMSTPKI